MAGRKKLEGPVNYFELPRKQLQSLCKKYGYPANRTNLLMAEFLTSHLNSDDYLLRDKSQPSPDVKTRFQSRDDEPTTDNNLPTISESQLVIFERNGRRLSDEFMNTDAAHTDCPLEASKAAGTGLGQTNQITSEDAAAAGFPVEEAMDFTTSDFRIRDGCRQHKTECVHDIPLPPSTTTEEVMDITEGCETEGPSQASRVGSGSGDFSNTEEAMDSASTGLGSQGFSMEFQESQESPLPLSVMPHVRPATPGNSTSSDTGVKLFVDLKTHGLSTGENLRDYYQAWGAAPLTWNVTQTQYEDVLSPLKALEGSEGKLPLLENHTTSLVSKADRAAEDQEGTKNMLMQTAVVSTSIYQTDAVPLKSCLLTETREPSPLSASFLYPPIFSSPRRTNDTVLDAERSEIVKEWSSEQTQETIRPIDVISCSDEEKTLNGDVVFRKVDENEVMVTGEAADNPVARLENDVHSISPERTSSQSEMIDSTVSRQVEDSSKSEEDAEQPSVASSFLNIDFTKMKLQNSDRGPVPTIELEIDCTKVREQITAIKSTALSPLDSNRLAMDKVVDSCPNPTTPTKSVGILDVLIEGEGKDNANGLSSCGKENEIWSRRQEQHKTPLTGRSKEKSLRAAEMKASNLREQLLKKRRGMTDSF